MRLYEERQGRGLTIISVSMDDSENEDQARSFLEAHGALFPAYITNTDNLKAFLEVMDPSWTGAIPTTFILTGTGKGRMATSGSYPTRTWQRNLTA